MNLVVDILRILLNVVWWIIVVQAILSWLIAFNAQERKTLVENVYRELRLWLHDAAQPLPMWLHADERPNWRAIEKLRLADNG